VNQHGPGSGSVTPTCGFVLERVTGIEPALSAWESSGERPLSVSPCYSCTSGSRACPTGAPESGSVRPVCETDVRETAFAGPRAPTPSTSSLVDSQ
jgi:hypothetical protein